MKTLFYGIIFLACAYGVYYFFTNGDKQKEIMDSLTEKMGIETEESRQEKTNKVSVLEYRTWTNTEGNQIVGKLVGLSLGKLKLLKQDDGQTYEFSISKLDQKDQEFLAEASQAIHAAEEELRNALMDFPPQMTDEYSGSSGNGITLDVDDFAVYSKYQNRIRSLTIWNLTEYLAEIRRNVDLDMEKYDTSEQNDTRSGAQAKLNYRWLKSRLLPYLDDLENILP